MVSTSNQVISVLGCLLVVTKSIMAIIYLLSTCLVPESVPGTLCTLSHSIYVAGITIPILFYDFFVCLFLFIYLFIYFWLCWVFVAACGLSLVAASGGYSLWQCAGFSLQWLLLLQSMGSRHMGFSSCSTRAP